MKHFCAACMKAEDKTQNAKLSVCAACLLVDRDVRYCNRECQRDAWKNHKRSCGKRLEPGTAPNTFGDVPNRFSGTYIPPTAPGYRRSAALLQQISFLNDNPAADYILEMSPPGRKKPIHAFMDLHTPDSASIFMVMRGYAMSSTGPRAEAALLYVYRLLQKRSVATVNEKLLQNQLRREYGATFDSVLAALGRGEPTVFEGEVSREDIEKALSSLKAAGRFKPQLGHFVSGAGGKSMKMFRQVGLHKDVRVVVDYPLDVYCWLAR
ncbi:hypothetical protein FB45DRAFT_396869 [Roridomyces roridus]|uniref:MYND-type domain-containing protein n=1 Tax=Roridomyces roridus TaxID=1738132 RepID=A0AAD7C398_9AGAR|nr:hypothetical protein FB45DRAFT_396869 [Roridomyces roridus]